MVNEIYLQERDTKAILYTTNTFQAVWNADVAIGSGPYHQAPRQAQVEDMRSRMLQFYSLLWFWFFGSFVFWFVTKKNMVPVPL